MGTQRNAYQWTYIGRVIIHNRKLMLILSTGNDNYDIMRYYATPDVQSHGSWTGHGNAHARVGGVATYKYL